MKAKKKAPRTPAETYDAYDAARGRRPAEVTSLVRLAQSITRLREAESMWRMQRANTAKGRWGTYEASGGPCGPGGVAIFRQP